MRLQKKAAGSQIPTGAYKAKFAGVEEWTENAAEYGPALRLLFQVTDGEHQGSIVGRIVSQTYSEKSALGAFVKGLTGGYPKDVDLERLVGTEGQLLVVPFKDGTRVESFTAIAPAQPDEAPF